MSLDIPVRLVIKGKKEFFGASSLLCIFHITTLSILMFLHFLRTSKRRSDHEVMPAMWLFLHGETGIKWIWGVIFEGKRELQCCKRETCSLRGGCGQHKSGVESPTYTAAVLGCESAHSHHCDHSCPAAVAANLLCLSSSCDSLSLFSALPCSLGSALPVSWVMALPCDGETVFGWEECWTHCGTPWCTCTWGESTDGNLSRFLRRSEGASQQIILGWDSAEGERKKRFSLFGSLLVWHRTGVS